MPRICARDKGTLSLPQAAPPALLNITADTSLGLEQQQVQAEEKVSIGVLELHTGSPSNTQVMVWLPVKEPLAPGGFDALGF